MPGTADEAAIASLSDSEQVAKSRVFNNEGKAFLRRELDRLGVAYRDSATNFLMFRAAWSGGELAHELLGHGVIIRPLRSFGLPDDCFRVSVGTPQENERFVRELERILTGTEAARGRG